MNTYIAEIQLVNATLTIRGDAAGAARGLAGPHREGRSVTVYRVEPSGDWVLVDMRTTRATGTVPSGYRGDWRRDPAWDAAVTSD